ncbi:MAG: sigma-70 domain-containing protein [Lachnospiraceae bacterium]|nr:sigma-70 domain-containing protein [Lachnospiraceae bacterium]
MNNEVLFKELLDQAVRKARCNHNYISEDEIKECFQTLQLSEDKISIIYDYLRNTGIKIGTFDAAEEDEELDEKDDSFLEMYLEELKLLPKHTEEESLQFVKEVLQGNSESKQHVINDYLSEVVDIAKLYAGQGVSIEDLIGEGNIGLMMGIELLPCIETPEEAAGHLGKMIMDAMDAAISSENEDIEFDRKILEKIERISAKAQELSEDLRREVTAEELAKEMDIEETEILEAMEITGNAIEGIRYE